MWTCNFYRTPVYHPGQNIKKVFSPRTEWIISNLHVQRVGWLHKVFLKYSHGKYVVLPWGWWNRNKIMRLVNRLLGDEQARMRNFFITSPFFSATVRSDQSGTFRIFQHWYPLKENFYSKRKYKIFSAWRKIRLSI